jgi:hypothetical protein
MPETIQRGEGRTIPYALIRDRKLDIERGVQAGRLLEELKQMAACFSP